MADLTHDTAEDGFHEIQLSGKQLVFLFMATSVVLVATFLCGVMVGRGVSAARGEEGASVAPPVATATAVDPAAVPAEPPSPPPDDELTYHQRLQGAPGQEPEKPQASPAEAVPPPVAETQPAEPAGAPDVPISGQPGTWVVQVTALQNRTAAAAIVRRLIGLGYPAYLEMPAAGAPAIYRVRIGRYAERREADAIAQRLQKQDQFDRPVVTR